MSRRGLLANGPGSSRTGSARPSTAASSSRGGRQQNKIQMPEYEPPSFALDTNARHALAELSRNTTDARRYGGELEKSVRLLGESVGEVNDRLQDRKEMLAARLEKRKDSGAYLQPSTGHIFPVHIAPGSRLIDPPCLPSGLDSRTKSQHRELSPIRGRCPTPQDPASDKTPARWAFVYYSIYWEATSLSALVGLKPV